MDSGKTEEKEHTQHGFIERDSSEKRVWVLCDQLIEELRARRRERPGFRVTVATWKVARVVFPRDFPHHRTDPRVNRVLKRFGIGIDLSGLDYVVRRVNMAGWSFVEVDRVHCTFVFARGYGNMWTRLISMIEAGLVNGGRREKAI